MRGHVTPDAVAKSILAKKTFEHEQKRLAFAIGCWIGCVVDLASPSISSSLEMPVRRVGSRGIFFSSQTSHCGLKCAVHLLPIHDAKPSLSQRLSHHAIVTRSPNH